MKRIFLYNTVVVLMLFTGVMITGCKEDRTTGAAEALSIKVYSPTKVVEGQEVTITGTGLGEVTSVIFPGNNSVTSVKVISDNMISVVTPAGIPAEGGELTVQSPAGTVTAGVPLTLGVPTFIAMTPNETVGSREELTIVGTDMEFFEKAIFPGEDEDVVINAIDFLRKSTSLLRIKVPMGIKEGPGQIKLVTVGGQELLLPELNLKPGATGEWQWKEITIWEGSYTVDWSKEFFVETAWFTAHDIKEDDTVTFYFTPKQGGTPMIKFYDDGWNNNFNIEGFEDNGQTAKAGNFTENNTQLVIPMTKNNLYWFTVPKNMNVTGMDVTITKITMTTLVWVENGENPGETKDILWTGSLGPINWTEIGKIILDADALGKLVAGKTLGIDFTCDPGTYNQIRVMGCWWTELPSNIADYNSQWNVVDFTTDATNYEFKLTQADIDIIVQQSGILCCGNGLTLKSLYVK